MSNPFTYSRKPKFWLVFPMNNHVGFWGFNERESAENFAGPSPTGGGKITIVEAKSREQAQELVTEGV